MRIVLFCENRYAIDILAPLQYEADNSNEGDEVLWYIHQPKITDFPLRDSVRWTTSMQEVKDFDPEAIFVPGNIVPYYLPGVKIQVFHGYAAEKKDHWIIRRYFDTYFTQGPYFTSHFEALSHRYGDFEVLETGWTKQDWIRKHLHDFDSRRNILFERYGKSRIALYAPTFSPKLTSLPHAKDALGHFLDENPDFLLVMKFHPLTRAGWVDEYRQWSNSRQHDTLYIEKGENITEWQLMSDLVISDTSSAVYEFLLLDRPVVTLGTIAKDIYWENVENPDELPAACRRALNDVESISRRRWIVDNYDPHNDGLCCHRMLEGARDYIRRHGVPRKRNLNLWRRYTSIKTFGKVR